MKNKFKKMFIGVLIILSIAGCANVPVYQTMLPEQPAKLKVECPPLPLLEVNEFGSKPYEVLETITVSLGMYAECQAKNQEWNIFYNEQKEKEKIYVEKINKAIK